MLRDAAHIVSMSLVLSMTNVTQAQLIKANPSKGGDAKQPVHRVFVGSGAARD